MKKKIFSFASSFHFCAYSLLFGATAPSSYLSIHNGTYLIFRQKKIQCQQEHNDDDDGRSSSGGGGKKTENEKD